MGREQWAHDLVEFLEVAEAAEHTPGARRCIWAGRQHLHLHAVELRRNSAARALSGPLCACYGTPCGSFAQHYGFKSDGQSVFELHASMMGLF